MKDKNICVIKFDKEPGCFIFTFKNGMSLRFSFVEKEKILHATSVDLMKTGVVHAAILLDADDVLEILKKNGQQDIDYSKLLQGYYYTEYEIGKKVFQQYWMQAKEYFKENSNTLDPDVGWVINSATREVYLGLST